MVLENTVLLVRSIETARYGKAVRFLIASEELAKNVNITLIVTRSPLLHAFRMLVLHVLQVLIARDSVLLLSAKAQGRLVNVSNVSQIVTASLPLLRDVYPTPVRHVLRNLIVRVFIPPQYAPHWMVYALNVLQKAIVSLQLLLGAHLTLVHLVQRILIVGNTIPFEHARYHLVYAWNASQIVSAQELSLPNACWLHMSAFPVHLTTIVPTYLQHRTVKEEYVFLVKQVITVDVLQLQLQNAFLPHILVLLAL